MFYRKFRSKRAKNAPAHHICSSPRRRRAAANRQILGPKSANKQQSALPVFLFSCSCPPLFLYLGFCHFLPESLGPRPQCDTQARGESALLGDPAGDQAGDGLLVGDPAAGDASFLAGDPGGVRRVAAPAPAPVLLLPGLRGGPRSSLVWPPDSAAPAAAGSTVEEPKSVASQV